MLQDMLKEKMNSMRTGSADDILTALGLERRRSQLDMIGSVAVIFGAGVLLGAAAGMLMAPKSGRALRQEIKNKASDLAETIGEKAESATQGVRSALSMDDAEKAKSLSQGKREENANTHRRA